MTAIKSKPAISEVLMRLALEDGNSIRGAQLFPIGKWRHPQGAISVNFERAQKFVQEFEAKAAGQDLPILYVHSDGAYKSNPRYGQAAGWISGMHADEKRGVLVDIDFTDEGADEVRAKKWRYLSAEYFNKITLPHHDRPHEDVIVGAALVNRPHLKGMDPILNEETGHLFVFNAEERNERKGNPMDPILAALAKSAGLELSEDIEELTDEQRKAIESHLSDASDKVTKLEGEAALLKKSLEDSEDPESKRVRTLAEAGYVEEAKLLSEYRGERMVRSLEADVPSGHALTPAVKGKIVEFALDNDSTKLTEAMAIMASGKGTVELTERGTVETSETSSGPVAETELLTLADAKVAANDKLSLSEAIDLVAEEKPELWNSYQAEVGAGSNSRRKVAS